MKVNLSQTFPAASFAPNVLWWFLTQTRLNGLQGKPSQTEIIHINSGIKNNSAGETIKKKLPQSYESIPTTLLGRLAIDINFKGKGLGKILLVDALRRSYEISKEIGSFAVVVDPIDREAELFYNKYEFIKLPDSGKMFIAIRTLKELFAKK